nr:zinc finger protein RFP-like [Anolis sagrei ordinatus]
MSSKSPRKRLQTEATCPSCLEYFIDPMILDCGHNLCFRCISHIWREPQVMARCPQCTAVVHRQNFKANLQLANMVEIARALGKQIKVEGDGGKCCKKHQEALKLFCKDDKIPICLVCDRSKQHLKHHVVPMEEADQEYKIWNCLETLREERDKIIACKTLIEKESQDLLKQTKAERTETAVEFQSLHLFLEEQKKHLLSQIDEVEEEIARERDENMARLSQELSSLETLIREMEEKQQQPADEPLEDIGNALERCRKWKLANPVAFGPELKWSIWDICDITPYLKNVLEQFKDHLISGFCLRRASLHFDPLTSGPWIILSADCKTMSEGDRYQALSNNPERFDTCSFVLAQEGFTTGRHFWEVHVGNQEQWAVGVAKESVKRKGDVVCGPAEGIWEMGVWAGEYRTFNPPADPILSLRDKPRKVYVTLNCEGRRVAFYDADRANLLCEFTETSFDREILRPWFYVAKRAHLTLSD